jgi:mannose-6-phosphate isomerase
MYPLKFQPVFQKRIWGGSRLKNVLAKSLPAEWAGAPVGESWELADLPAGTVKGDSVGAAADGSLSSVITNGPWKGKSLHDVLPNSGIMGTATLGKGGRFPLLIKFLDAQTDLSVQVHPNEAYAAKHADAHLKSEAWYVLYAEPGAKIYKGVKPGVDAAAFRAALESGGVEPLLNAIPVRAGDCHYLKSGTVHALGAGILAAEVQTPSDTTFRVFDWNRLGPDGKPRALHVEQAMEVIDFSGLPTLERREVGHGTTGNMRLVSCDYFNINRTKLTGGQQQMLVDAEPIVLIATEGQGVITCDGAGPTAFTRGDTLLIPANIKNGLIKAIADCAWLEARLPVKAGL